MYFWNCKFVKSTKENDENFVILIINTFITILCYTFSIKFDKLVGLVKKHKNRHKNYIKNNVI